MSGSVHSRGGRRRLALAGVASLVLSVLVAAPVSAAGPTYEEVSDSVGMGFSHVVGTTCVPPIGVGSAWGDFDDDGDVDHFITNRGGANGMFRNVGDTNGDGLPNFEDVAVAAGVDDPLGSGHGAVFVDMDNDGDQDLYVTNHGGNTLYRNDGDTNSDGIPDFVDITTTAGVADGGRAITAAWGDFNNDSLLDLYVAKHIECGGAEENSQDHLFMNLGGGVFTDATSYLCDGLATCPEVEGLGFTAAWVDYDNDRDPDLYLVNDNIVNAHEPNRLWRNDGSDGAGGWDFTEVSASVGADTSLNGMGLGVGDYNNDGFFDFAFSNGGPSVLLQNNAGSFTDVSVASGVNAATEGTVTWGTAFFDHDFDGDEDLYIVAGNIHTGGIPNIFLDNNADGTFTDISDASGLADRGKGRSATMNDFDADGWVDVWVGNYNQPSSLLRNRGADEGFTNNWVAITVEGVESNRDGIGTRIELTSASGTQIREINSGPTHGGGDQRVAWIGLGADSSADLVVKWPNGVDQTITGVTLNQYTHLVEPASGPAGEVNGYVFRDLDGDGIENGSDGPMAGVSVSVDDSGGNNFSATTNSLGVYSVLGVDPGSATVTYTTPTGAVLTTGNAVQVVTVVDGGSVAAADVGYEPPPSGDLSGRVFNDLDGNGVEDGSDTGLAGVAVSVTDFGGVVHAASSDSNGDYIVVGLAPGDASVVHTTPAGFSVTTGNASQTVNVVVDQTTAAASVGYQSVSMTQPDIRRIQGDDTIEAGTTDTITVVVDGYETGATWSFEASGLTVTSQTLVTARRVALTVVADASASVGRSDITITNPGGLSDTLVDGIEVLAGAGGGEIVGHVFGDLDGNGLKDGSDAGLSGVSVTITDFAGSVFAATTDTSGNFAVGGLADGDATVDFATPASHTLTTGNSSQTIAVIEGVSAAAADVGYLPPATPAPDLVRISGSGAVFQGTSAVVRVVVTGFVAGGTWTVSGTGVTVTNVVDLGGRVELTLDVAVDAPVTQRDLTLVNPDGQSDTLLQAIVVRP